MGKSANRFSLSWEVVAHAIKRKKRGKLHPSLSYKGIKNPELALKEAVLDLGGTVRRLKRKSYNSSLIGTGDYCPDCDGLCGNDKHDRRW